MTMKRLWATKPVLKYALFISHTHTLWKTRPPRPAARSQSSPPVSLHPSLSPFSCRYNNEPTEAGHCGTPAVWVRDSKGGKRKMCVHQLLLQEEKRRVCEAAEKKGCRRVCVVLWQGRVEGERGAERTACGLCRDRPRSRLDLANTTEPSFLPRYAGRASEENETV